jgi:hypothetical protein
VLLAERREPTQGALLRHWLQQAVVPAVAGRILAVDAAVALLSAALHGPDPKPFRDGLIAATALVHSLVVVTRNLADFEATGVHTPPTVLLLCLWAWRGLLAALWAGVEECCRLASDDGFVRLLPAAFFNYDFC